MAETKTILLVDDSENDLFLMQTAFKRAQFDVPLQKVQNGEDAITYLKGESPYADRSIHPLPTLVLLDLNMPRKTGFEVLAWVRSQPILKRIPIIILTASLRPEDVERAFDLGANGFLVKPATLNTLIAMMGNLRDWIAINQFPQPQTSDFRPRTSDHGL